MATLSQVLERNANRNTLQRLIITSLLYYPVVFLLLIITYSISCYAATNFQLFKVLYLPFSILIVSSFKLVYKPDIVWTALRTIAILMLTVGLILTVYFYLTNRFSEVIDVDIYICVFLIVIFFSKSSAYTSSFFSKIVVLSSCLFTIMMLSLSFHFFVINFITIYPKAELTFHNSIVTGKDLQNTIEEINLRSPTDQTDFKNDPYINTLHSLNMVVFNENSLKPIDFDKDFQRKHIDALVKVYYKDEIKKTFFPSGYFCYKRSLIVNDYYLKNIQVKYNTEFGHLYEVRMVFKRTNGTGTIVNTSTDIDDVDSTFTAPVKSKVLGTFDLKGIYHFKKSPNELKDGAEAITAYFSTGSDIDSPMIFTYFKPDLQN